MPYVFFPVREPADPDGVADRFSESLSHTEGYWLSWTGSANLVLDDMHVVSRLHSIKIDSPQGASDYYIGAIFRLYNPFDVSKCEAFRFRIAAVNKGDPPNLLGNVLFSFTDIHGNRAQMNLGVELNGVYYAKELRMDDPNWDVHPAFDWTQVVEWSWLMDCTNINPFTWPGCSMWLDVGPFLYWWEEPGPPPPKTWVRLRCVGVATAQCVIFHEEYSETVMVPTDFTVSPAGVWGFRALGEGFEYWIVNDIRYDEREIQVNLEEESDTTLTMHYKAVAPPLPSIGDVAIALGVISAIITIGGVIYAAFTYPIR